MSFVTADSAESPTTTAALHPALVDASIALAREGGPDRVILREAAQVPAAPRPPFDYDAWMAKNAHSRRGTTS